MKIWIVRHGETNLNKKLCLQGRVNEPLNERGRQQARSAAEQVRGIRFDAVWSGPLDRAVETACIISGRSREQILTDERITEIDFGKYDCLHYWQTGTSFHRFWLHPNRHPAPGTIESIQSMVNRSSDFLRELEQRDYENVLVVCHGAIIRSLCGVLEDAPNGIVWWPRPKNCEIRIYESSNGKHSRLS